MPAKISRAKHSRHGSQFLEPEGLLEHGIYRGYPLETTTRAVSLIVSWRTSVKQAAAAKLIRRHWKNATVVFCEKGGVRRVAPRIQVSTTYSLNKYPKE
jgi:hypothetical protein